MRKRFSVIAMVVIAMMLVVPTVLAATLQPGFTQNELDNNWEADRYFPTDGATSVTAFGRTDVARLGIDSSMTQSGTFQRTEGIKTVGDQNFGNDVHFDLYIDPDWEGKAVRAGFWVVGDLDDGSTGTGARDNLFGILEFVNLEPSTSGISAQGDHEGWRFWDSLNGWTDLSTAFSYGEWVTLGISLDTDAQEYRFYLNGDHVGTGVGGENFIRELFLNSYNYGLDVFPNLSSDSYSAHWHAGIELVGPPTDRSECMDGGWASFNNPTFKNQGDCISYVRVPARGK